MKRAVLLALAVALAAAAGCEDRDAHEVKIKTTDKGIDIKTK